MVDLNRRGYLPSPRNSFYLLSYLCVEIIKSVVDRAANNDLQPQSARRPPGCAGSRDCLRPGTVVHQVFRKCFSWNKISSNVESELMRVGIKTEQIAR